jgi:ketosteroid isomerase-like protein
MTNDEIRDLALRAHAAFFAGDGATLDSLLAPDCTLHQCGFLEPLTGQEIKRFSQVGGQALSDRRVRVETAVVEGDMVALRWTSTGRHTGYLVPEATGKEVAFDSMTFFRVEGGKIAEAWNIQDRSSLMTQLEEFAASG